MDGGVALEQLISKKCGQLVVFVCLAFEREGLLLGITESICLGQKRSLLMVSPCTVLIARICDRHVSMPV